MRAWLAIVAFPTLFAGCAPPPSGGAAEFSPEEEKVALETMMERFLEARNNFDADAIGEFFDSEYDQGNINAGRLQITSGPERVDAYRTAFAEGTIENKLEQEEVHSVRFVTPEVAIMDVEHRFTTPEGDVAFRNFATYILVKKNGKWLISAVRLSPVVDIQ